MLMTDCTSEFTLLAALVVFRHLRRPNLDFLDRDRDR